MDMKYNAIAEDRDKLVEHFAEERKRWEEKQKEILERLAEERKRWEEEWKRWEEEQKEILECLAEEQKRREELESQLYGRSSPVSKKYKKDTN